MTNKTSFTTRIVVHKSTEEAQAAILNFRSWWSEEIEGPTDELGKEFFYHYKDIHLCKIKLTELLPKKRIVYTVTENEFNFIDDKTEWVNTRLIFEMEPKGDSVEIVFTHEGLVPEYACYEVCNDAWTGYIQGSLKNKIETGTGNPNPKDGEGFNAELARKWKLD